jgi:hypothetical protein
MYVSVYLVIDLINSISYSFGKGKCKDNITLKIEKLNKENIKNYIISL